MTSPDDLHGYILMAASCIGFSMMTFFFHIAETTFHFPARYTVFIRGFTHTILACLYIASYLNIRETITALTPRQRKLLVFRGFIGAFGVFSMVLSLKYLPMGDAISLFFINPVITLILSNLVLSEPLTALDCIAALVSFVGVVLISRPDGDLVSQLSVTHRLVGSICSIMAAFSAAIAYVTIRSLGTSLHYMLNVLALAFATMIISIPLGGFTPPEAIMQNKWGSFYVILGSLAGFTGQSSLNKGLQYCRVGPGILIRNLDLPLAYLLGMLFLDESPTPLRLLGSGMVLCMAIMIGVRKIRATS